VFAERCDEDDVRIRRGNADLRDAVGFAEAERGPGLSGISAFVDAISRHDVAANARLAHADEDNSRIGFGDSDGTDARTFELAVGDRRPVLATIVGLPEAT